MPNDTTEDDFLGGALRIRQPAGGFRAGVDSILLAAVCTAAGGQRVLDCGAGVGVVGLAVARRVAGVQVVLAERVPELLALAGENIGANGLTDRVSAVACDVGQPSSQSPLAGEAGRFDHVLANPPFFEQESGTRSPDSLRDASHAMPAGQLDRWLRFMAGMCAAGGRATMIQRSERLLEVLAAFDRRFGALTVRPVQARPDGAAGRVIVSGCKGSRAPLTLLPALVLHGADGHAFTPAAEAILKGGGALDPGC